MIDEQNSRIDGKLDLMLSNIQQMQIDIATMKTGFENRLSSLEAWRDGFTKVVIGVLIAVIGGLLLVIFKLAMSSGGLKL
jgi:hypothetical protein